MYSTKYRSHVKADVGAMSLHKNDPYAKDKKKTNTDSRHEGRQFKGGPGNWETLNKIKYAPCPYEGRMSYLKAEKKLGFGSGDAPKRDEYSNFIAIEQYREAIRSVDKSAKVAKDRIAKEKAAKAAASGIVEEDSPPQTEESKEDEEDFLYDRVFKVNHDNMVGKARFFAWCLFLALPTMLS